MIAVLFDCHVPDEVNHKRLFHQLSRPLHANLCHAGTSVSILPQSETTDCFKLFRIAQLRQRSETLLPAYEISELGQLASTKELDVAALQSVIGRNHGQTGFLDDLRSGDQIFCDHSSAVSYTHLTLPTILLV